MQSTNIHITSEQQTKHRATVEGFKQCRDTKRRSHTSIVLALKSAQGTEQATTYREALTALLLRVVSLPGAELVGAWCSARTVADKPAAERSCLPTTIDASDFADMQPDEQRAALADAMRKEIQRRCARVGRAKNAKGSGNPTRALTLAFELPGLWSEADAVNFFAQPHSVATFGSARTARDAACSIELRTEHDGQIAMWATGTV